MACARLDEDAMCLWRREHVNNIGLGVAEHLFDIGKCGGDAMCGRKRLRCRLIEIAACDKRRVVNGPDGLGMHRCHPATADERDAKAGRLTGRDLPTDAHTITKPARPCHVADRIPRTANLARRGPSFLVPDRVHYRTCGRRESGWRPERPWPALAKEEGRADPPR